MFGLDNPSWGVILLLLFNVVLFPFHVGIYVWRTRMFEEKNEHGVSIYTRRNVTLYVIAMLLSPLLSVIVLLVGPLFALCSEETDFNKDLPRGKWFWPLKVLLGVLIYLITLPPVLVGWVAYSLLLMLHGLTALFQKMKRYCI
jgi:uncharacterized membrane protein YozB (DUF420 family)